MTTTKRTVNLPPPKGYMPWREALAAYYAQGGARRSKQRWGQLLAAGRVRGTWWDGYHWWGRKIEVLPGKMVTGAPKSKGRKK